MAGDYLNTLSRVNEVTVSVRADRGVALALPIQMRRWKLTFLTIP